MNELSKTVLHPKGLRVVGAHITGKLDLEGAQIPIPVRFEDCVFDDGVILRNARVKVLDFGGSQIKQGGLSARNIIVEGDLSLNRRFTVLGRVDLAQATIGGSVRCDSSNFDNPVPYELNAEGRKRGALALDCSLAKIEGAFLIRHAQVKSGEARFHHTNIRGNLECDQTPLPPRHSPRTDRRRRNDWRVRYQPGKQ